MLGPAGNGQSKIDAAKAAVRGLVDRLPDDVSLGLRVYGATVPNTDRTRGCRDSQSVIPVGPLDRAHARTAVAGFDAKGFTPISLALRGAAADLPARGPRTIVLVSDGINTCPPPPCPVAAQLHARGIDLRIETVGFRVDARARAELRCIARRGGGSYSDATSAADLAQQLGAASLRSLRTYEPRGRRVTGAAQAAAAPVLGPGQYVDRLAGEDSRWYAVRVQRGQMLLVGGALVPPRQAGGTTLDGRLHVNVVGPAGQPVIPEGDHQENAIGYRIRHAEPVPFGVRSRLAGGRDPNDAAAIVPAGTYRIHVTLAGARALAPSFPLELVVSMLGRPQPPPAPSLRGGGTQTRGEPPVAPIVAAAAVLGLLGLAAGRGLGRRGGRGSAA